MGSPAPFSRELRRVWNVHACTGSRTPPGSLAPCHERYARCGLLPDTTGSAHGNGASCSRSFLGRCPRLSHFAPLGRNRRARTAASEMSLPVTFKFLERRIGDPRILRLIRKWLRAGVSEDGEWSPNTVGTPQGAVASPLLANVYLHYVFDLWIQWWRKSCRGDVVIVRYADDFVIGFENHNEATACLEALHTRFARFGLKLHKDKTRLPNVCVRRYRRSKSNCGNVCITRSAKRAAGCGVLCRAG